MPLTCLNQGAASETWQQTTPVAPGAPDTITTEIQAQDRDLDFLDVILVTNTIVGEPVGATPAISLVNGRVQVVFGNTGPVGSGYTYTVRIDRRHSVRR